MLCILPWWGATQCHCEHIVYLSYKLEYTNTLFQSLLVADAIYNSNWLATDDKTRRFILFFLLRAQKSVQVRTTFFEADLVTFKTVTNMNSNILT